MEHYYAVERKVKNLLYRQPLTGSFSLAGDGYLEYRVNVVLLLGYVNSESPQVNYQCSWRTLQNQAGPAVAPIWNPWQNYIVASRTNDQVVVPPAWASSGQNLRPLGVIPVTNVTAAGHVFVMDTAVAAGVVAPAWHAGAHAALIQNSGAANAQVIEWTM